MADWVKVTHPAFDNFEKTVPRRTAKVLERSGWVIEEVDGGTGASARAASAGVSATVSPAPATASASVSTPSDDEDEPTDDDD